MAKKIATLLAVSVLGACFLTSCASTASRAETQTPEELSAKLNESKTNAESATRELNDLRNEKARLEAAKGGSGAAERK
jgi:hypothetical protein